MASFSILASLDPQITSFLFILDGETIKSEVPDCACSFSPICFLPIKVISLPEPRALFSAPNLNSSSFSVSPASSYENLKVLCCSVVPDSLQPHKLYVAHQAPLSMGFSRQESWSGLPFLPPGALPDPGIEPGSPALQTNSLPSEPPGKPYTNGQLSPSLGGGGNCVPITSYLSLVS